MAKIVSLDKVRETLDNFEKQYLWKKDLKLLGKTFPQPVRCDFDLAEFEQKKGALIWTRKQS
jgi:hypothetical protein